MMSSINTIHRLKLTTVSPISIGGDQADTLSPYADFIVTDDEQKIIYLKKEVIEQKVMEKGLLEEYVRSIQMGMDNNRSEFDLKSFIRDRLELGLDSVSVREVNNHGYAYQSKQEIKPIIKSKNRPFIPGSSIKGALRTAILFNWLVGAEKMDPQLNSYYYQIDQWRQLESEIKRLKKRSGNYDARKTIKDNNDRIRDIKRKLFDESKLFGHITKSESGPDARRMKLTDTSILDSGLGIFGGKRIRLLKGKDNSAIPIVREAIEADQNLDFQLSIEAPFSNPKLKYLENNQTEKILKAVNNFTLDSLDNELEELNLAKNADFKREIEDLKGFYHDLQDRAKNGEVFIRIGFGKTIFDNSLMLALLYGSTPEQSSKAFYTYQNLMLRVRSDNDIFPITRTVTDNNLPFGWAKLEAQ